MGIKKRNIFKLIMKRILIKEVFLLLFLSSFISLNYESINAYELIKQEKLFSTLGENKNNIIKIGFKKLPDKKSI